MRRLATRLLGCLTALLAGSQLLSAQSAPAAPQLGRAPLRAILTALTDSEKVRLVVGRGVILPDAMPTAMLPPTLRVTLPTADDRGHRVPGAAGETRAVKRLGIPAAILADGPAGVRIDPIRRGADGKPDSSTTYYATAFPVGTLLASSWDTALVRRVGVAIGEEARAFGVDVMLTPGMNLHRNPLGGRNFEYFSEDPLLTGLMASAMVTGIQSKGVGTSVKHFVANEQEFNRMRLNSTVSERALRELYLKPFQMVVQRAKPWTVMSSYNLVNGVHTAEQRELLTDILRGEWGYDGLVMSDWFGGENPAAMVNAGNDLLMPGTASQEAALREALAKGTLSREALDSSVARVLALVLRTNTFRDVPVARQPDITPHARVAREAAAGSLVLLRNERRGARPALPLSSGAAVAAFGNTSYDPITGGTGSGMVNRKYTVSLAQGLTAAQLRVDAAVMAAYDAHLKAERAKLPPPNPMNFFSPPPTIPELATNDALVAQAASRNDVAVVTIGRIAGEGGDRKVEDDFTLRASERALLQQVSAAFHAAGKPVIVVLNIGGPIEVASWREQVDAIVLAYQPGQEGGHAITDVLRGAVNPSGRLATSFPLTYGDVPFASEFPGRVKPGAEPGNMLVGQASENSYTEGVYVGYRYATTNDKPAAYPFGFGLSYTTFTTGTPQVTGAIGSATDGVTVRVSVRNTGTVAGREVVQLFVGAPKGTLDKPVRELRAFTKTRMLAPGASQVVTFRLTAADLASWDPSTAAWVAESGQYTIGTSVTTPGTARLALPRTVVVARTRHLLVPPPAVQ